LSQAIWLRHRAQWPHPSDHAESRREHHVPYGNLDRISTTASWRCAFSGTHEGARRTVAQLAGPDQCRVPPGPALASYCRFLVGVIEAPYLKNERSIPKRSIQANEENYFQSGTRRFS